jgi:soluble lytic murein transglycosylase-like protein
VVTLASAALSLPETTKCGGGVPMHTGRTETAAWLGLFVFLFAGAAGADVIEVEPDGTTVTYSGRSASPPSPVFSGEQRTGRTSRLRLPASLHAAASQHDIADALVGAVAWQESRWRQSAISARGARGLMQLMPSTAKSLGVNAADPDGNANGGAAYLEQLLRRFDGDVVRALAAYNAGPAAVIRYGGIPPYPETQKYVAAILDHLADISVNQSSSGASQ